ncbi:electron transport complex subunit RsxG [Marinihelvus fidelis]|uniref:Ion-translocating oxidoreductase complex subunit G n=1 Tax=Marinihelvus fidelis TaxID=2613842 RepID=A0A5N0TCU0_9GAMM|nr:electron transport complex subunit RsxG [Marinihelvus fidelis]KAA9132498.1 electron transport complex subunit RsxG [Marinihelvus fidelis]
MSEDSALRSGLTLALIAVAGVALLTAVHMLTDDRIAAQQRDAVARRLAQVLAPDRYDNDLLHDVIEVTDPETFGHPGPARVFRARRNGEPVAVIMEVTAPNGYNGAIDLLVGVLADGTVSGVRVVRHRETPGLGDPIEARRSDWITRFNGRALGDPPAEGWAVHRDGGEFDQFTGATITPRAVVAAIRRALVYEQQHRQALYQGDEGNE